ncbi:MAG: hypothetical protein CSA49_04140 [Gammaproteobacteria bacterium]|nr:MAG: hypothetical protein CSA49_04140 [Gammaproteobacteria bacterium]
MATQSYTDRLNEELQGVPDEYMPALIDIVHAFRQGVVQKSLEESFARSWAQAKAGKTHPIDALWDDIETD